jgi:rod shape-determining protein MreD
VTPAAVFRCAVVIGVSLVLQYCIVDGIRIAGAHPDLMILLPIAGGYVAGPERGAAFGFAVGIATDLLLPTTFGLSALVGCLLGFGVGIATSGLERSSWVLPPVIFAAATATGVTAYAILGAVLGEPLLVKSALPAALVVCVPTAVILAVPALRVVAWALPVPAPSEGRRSGGSLR